MNRAGYTKLFSLAAAGAMALTACGGGAERDDTGALVEADDDFDVFALELGDCFQNFDAILGVSEVAAVPCSEPHDNEVYLKFDLDGDDFPGDAVVEDLAFEGCLERFDAFIGAAYEESIYGLGALWPTDGSWSEGDREVVCYVSAGEQSTGSARNSGVTLEADASAAGSQLGGLEPGQCFNDSDVGAGDVEVVGCETPHDYELYATFGVDFADYPGADAMSEAAGQGCAERFEPFVGTDYASSIYYARSFPPTEVGWSSGDREVLCALYLEGEQAVGSAAGSGQ